MGGAGLAHGALAAAAGDRRGLALIMQPQSFDDVLAAVLAKDRRYGRDAYEFVREALDYTQRAISKSSHGSLRHISGQELLAGIRAYALEQYGPMALTLLNEWGVQRCEDFGEIVFNLVEHGLFSKTESDRRADFQGVYDFTEAFRKPFLPTRPPAAAPKLPSTTSA
jgi:uncharacterized repeat protein (TIGR04138 family)